MALKDLNATLKKIKRIEEKLIPLEKRLTIMLDKELKLFEEKIQKMTFAYTSNLDDSKSEYLKRYLETRLRFMEETIISLPLKLADMQGREEETDD